MQNGPLSEKDLMKKGQEAYGSAFSTIMGIYETLKPLMRNPHGCLEALVAVSPQHGRIISGSLVRELLDYAGRLPTAVTPDAIEFQVGTALQAHRLGLAKTTPVPVYYPGMYGTRVFTGQPDLGPRPGIDPRSLPPR